MNLARYTRLAAAAFALTHCAAAAAQVFDLAAGASTLYGAEGASVTIHGTSSETALGAGLINGHLSAGAASTYRLHAGSVTTGQQQFSMELPTDIFGGGQILTGTGIGFRTAPGPGRAFSGFAGVSSAESGTPLFQSASLNSPAAYLQWKQPISDSLTSLSTALFSSRTGGVFLESLSWAPSPRFTYAFTAGIGGGDPYAAASVLYKSRKLALQASYILAGDRFQRGTDPELAISEPVHENLSAEYHLTRTITLSGLHRNFLTPLTTQDDLSTSLTSTSAIRSSLDEAGIQYNRTSTVLNLNLLHSRSEQQPSFAPAGFVPQISRNFGLSAGFTRKVGSLDWSEHFYESIQPGNNHTALLVNGLAIDVNPHLRLTESINLTAGGPTFSHGGALLTSFSSFEVDYQLLYIATRTDNPFQQAMVFNCRIRIVRDLWLQASSSIGPTGSILYTFRVGKQFTRNAPGTEPVPVASFGQSVLRGRVVDEQGAPVEGAALRIDSTQLYTDSKGIFFFREKIPRAHPFSVATDDFMQIGRYVVVSAPKFIRSAPERDSPPVTIVVRRLADSPAEIRRPLTLTREEGRP